jgi:hypothetical protein
LYRACALGGRVCCWVFLPRRAAARRRCASGPAGLVEAAANER